MKIILPTDTFFKWSQGAWPVANNIVNNFKSVWTLCIIFRNFIFRQNIHICMYVGAYRRFFKGSLGAWPVENNIVNNFISVWTLCIIFFEILFIAKTYISVCM